ncbi:hypothetical protein ACTJJ4_03015 [Microbacterium sp. 22195]|uniref:hypothetical protein n=1 Tax=Microbacterium sp. 22195 TaxID=3453891 RepID=UPI003F824B96
MTVPGYTEYGLAERLMIGGVFFVYDPWLKVWQGPDQLEYLPSQIHSMLLSGSWKVRKAAS